MGDHAKKNESEQKMNENDTIDRLLWSIEVNHGRINQLERRILDLEKALISVTHTNTDDGSRHRNDGGWFD